VAEVIESLLSKGKDPNSNSHTSKKKKKSGTWDFRLTRKGCVNIFVPE
jgi:hypothetical protein